MELGHWFYEIIVNLPRAKVLNFITIIFFNNFTEKDTAVNFEVRIFSYNFTSVFICLNWLIILFKYKGCISHKCTSNTSFVIMNFI